VIRPTPPHALLLATAFADDEQSATAWDRVRRSLDLGSLGPGAVGLLPLVHRRLEQRDVDDPLRQRLAGIHRRTWYLNRVRIERLAPVWHALEHVGAAPLLMGSWELPALYYGDLGARDVPGLHALIRGDSLEAAGGALSRLGWTGPTSATAHAVRFLGPHGDECVLYRRRLREFPARGTEAEHEDASRDSIDVAVQNVRARAISGADELVRVCLDAVPPGGMWVADAVTILRNPGTIDWQCVVDGARRHGAALPLRESFLYLRSAFSVAIPDDALEALARTPVLRRDRIAYRLSKATLVPPTIPRFLRATAGEPAVVTVSSLMPFLRDEWGLSRRSETPRVAARKLSLRTRSLLRRGARGAGA
jgi:hypothetical protein